ncbi:protein MICAL-3 [Camelus ferus]|nr:protein MICAL-3 [Camelus ferus]
MEETKTQTTNRAHVLFDRFVQATTCKGTLRAFQELCDHLELKPKDHRSFYHKLKSKLNYWRAKALWAKLDKRGSHKDYKKGKACTNTKCLIIGAGPCGLRTAIDLSLLGAKVVVIEKRDAFSRNNVLHLWPFTIHDLRGLGAKKFYGKFCAGAIDHISIRQLQLILLKVALILGIEIHVNVEFQGLVQPPEDQENERIGWRALVHPKTHPVSEYEFEVIIGGDGRRNTLEGFRRKEFRGKLAIAITANFINRNTTAEAKVEEISGIDLENIVYYKDDTHYFVMTAKKQSLLDKGVILHDYADTELLLSRENVDQEALLNYAREAADFSTQQQLPSLDFAINHYGQPDVAMFDFTCMYASENAALVREHNGHPLLVALVGDSLLEPFWPMGTGIARGFLAAMDSAWMVRSWSLGRSPLEVLAERESIYRLLPQTTPENVSKNFSQYSIDPVTRYPNVNVNFLRPSQVRHLYDTGETKDIHLEMENLVNSRTTPKVARNESVARSSKLLSWCQRQTDGYAGVDVTDLTTSWKSGLALCALIHRYRPDLIDFDSLDEQNVEKNNQLAFDVAEKELGISPIMTGKEMASVGEPDKLSMVMYLTQFYEMFRDALPSRDALDLNAEEKAVLIASTKSPISFLSKLGQTISRKRSPKDKKEKDVDGAGKRRKTSQSEEEDAPRGHRGGRPMLVSTLTDRRMDMALGNQNKVKYMATQLLAKFEENAPAQSTGVRRQGSIKKEFPQNLGGSDTCYFCQKRVYVMERLSAEGKFFHRSCFKCEYCATTLRLSAYAYDLEGGKFYCKPHYCYRLSGSAQRKRPAVAPLSGKEARAPLQDGPATDTSGRPSAGASPAERTPGSSVNGLEEPSVAKRLRGTPERIELENYRLSVRQAEGLQEVPEETQAEHNLSSVLDTGTEEDVASRCPIPAAPPSLQVPHPCRCPIPAAPPSLQVPHPCRCPIPAAPPSLQRAPVPPGLLGLTLSRVCWRTASPFSWAEMALQHRLLTWSPGEPLPLPHLPAPFDEEELEEDADSEPAEREGEAVENGDTGDTGAELDDEDATLSAESQRLGDQSAGPGRGADADQHWSDDAPSLSEAGTELQVQHQVAAGAGLELRVSEGGEETPPATAGRGERGPSHVSSPIWPPEEQAALPSPAHSPGAQPVPARTSTPLAPLPAKRQGDTEDTLGSPLAGDEALRRSDLVAEFWMKSAEIRRSLGLTPVCRGPTPTLQPVSPKPHREEVRKSFVESVDEIPFADDVEDTYDDRTEDSSLQETFFTPPSCWALPEKPPQLPQAKENEAKELATQRMRAREKSVRSQALRDAMARQLSRMKEDTGPAEPTLRHDAMSEEVLCPPSDSGGPDGSVTSSEGSSGKSKKRSSLFSPRRNKKEKKPKGEGQPPERPSPSPLEEVAAKPSGATVDTSQPRASPVVRAELQSRHQRSCSEDSDLSSDDILERASQKSRREPRTYTEEELNAKLTRRVQKAARRQAKQEELKRLHRAQIIQRQLEQVEEKQRQLEERGVAVEKALRGEAGMGKKDDPKLMQEWFTLVQEKNALVRYESELMIFARELELEDRQSRLQQELRERMAVEDHLKTEEELSEEKRILNEMLEVVEQRDALVALLEEQRLREKEEDKDLEAAMLSKGFSLNWS